MSLDATPGPAPAAFRACASGRRDVDDGRDDPHYVALGAQVCVVTCTLGEEGEVIGDRYAQLTVDAADQLGGYRIGELTTALRALGVGEPIFLGGAGRWRDSGWKARRRETDRDSSTPTRARPSAHSSPSFVNYAHTSSSRTPDHIHTFETDNANGFREPGFSKERLTLNAQSGANRAASTTRSAPTGLL